MKKNAPTKGRRTLLLLVDTVLENFLDIESVTTTFPVILGVERAVTLDVDPAPLCSPGWRLVGDICDAGKRGMPGFYVTAEMRNIGAVSFDVDGNP